tara:strand:- start:407 stop:655 length:249 start_codon:yes stop_codon:yes gene_type:complete
MSKFIVGDLVTLSSAGRKNKHNDGVYGKIGIVIHTKYNRTHPYQIKWINVSNCPMPSGSRDKLPMAEYEIKFAKNGVVEDEV